MRMLATHYTGKAEPAIAKKKRAQIAHVLPPLKGLSQATMFTAGDPQTATILVNFVVEDDSIKCRAGYKKIATRGTAAIWHLIPWYGVPTALLAASNHELWNAQNGTLVKGGFTSDDWHWTSFSNLGVGDYTIMVNGADGVWSWNGTLTPDTQGLVAVTNLSKSNPAVCTVDAADIGKFSNSMIVLIAGAVGPGLLNANGYRTISNVNSPPNTFTLVGVDTSTAAAPQTSGVTADPTKGLIKETITAPSAEAWISPNSFNVVVSHMNRLFFADSSHLAVYYLPLQQKTGEVKILPLNAVFRRGGTIRAMYTWTMDGGAGMDDTLVIFSTNGECVIYKGTDPDTDFSLVGIFRFDSPMSKHSVAQYGGELYCLISTGLVPMSTMLRAESEHLGSADKNITSLFLRNAIQYRTDQGWQTFLNPSTGRMFCNIPQGAPNRYLQLIRHMPKEVWTTFEDVPARCWNWIDPYVYFGDDEGSIYQMHPTHFNDDGNPIRVDVQMAWNNFKTPAKKHFLVLQTYLTSDGSPRPVIDMKVDYDYSKGVNTPDIGEILEGSTWDVALWDLPGQTPPLPEGDFWAPGNRGITIWNGICPLGHVGAIRLTTLVQNSSLFVNGWDVVFEAGTFT